MGQGALQAESIALRYDVDARALPPTLAACLHPLAEDPAARSFVQRALAAPHGALTMAAYRALRRVMSDYDAHGLLHMYPMHLLSTAQAAELLDRDPAAARGRLLDVGAGNGSVTAQLAPLFAQVWVTEASRVMRRRLAKRGHRVAPWELERAPAPERFEVVSCLNVIDRCLRPRSLLANAAASLADGGKLLLSVPLPLSPHVHVGSATVDPDEPLPGPAPTWEAGAAALAGELFAPLALRVTRLSRAPYLCRGDTSLPLYSLDTAVFVLSSAQLPASGTRRGW